MDTTVKTTAD